MHHKNMQLFLLGAGVLVALPVGISGRTHLCVVDLAVQCFCCTPFSLSFFLVLTRHVGKH